MHKYKPISILYLGPATDPPVKPSLDYLRDLAHVDIAQDERFSAQYEKVDAVITAGRGQVACTTLQSFDHVNIQQLCYRVLRVLTGGPLAAPLSDSIEMVAILEAAARSMASGGRAEVLHV